MSKGPRRHWTPATIDGFMKAFMDDTHRHQVAGSIRRKENLAGDVDIVTTEPTASIRARLEAKGVQVFGGNQTITAYTRGGRFGIIHAEPSHFGATLMHATGPKGSNIRNRMIAQSKGWTLNQYGLFDGRGRLLASTEKGIYERLGKTWRPAERRGTPRR